MLTIHFPCCTCGCWFTVAMAYHIYTKLPNAFEHFKKKNHSNEHKVCNKLKLQNVTMQHKDQNHNHNEGDQVPQKMFSFIVDNNFVYVKGTFLKKLACFLVWRLNPWFQI